MLQLKLFKLSGQVAASALPIALIALTSNAAQAFQLTRLYVFGDSLSDIGNFYTLTGQTLPPSQLGYVDGRFSNGAVWVDYLAPKLGLISDLRTNFALAGSTTGSQNTSIPGLPALQQQIALFTQTVPQADPNALYVLWAGANDYLNIGQQTNPAIPVANLAGAIQTLAGVGAKNFLVANLPDLGRVPLVRDRGTAVSSAATAIVNGHNALLAQTLTLLKPQLASDVNLIPLDVFSVFNRALNNPGAFGFTNTTQACLFPSPLLFNPLPAPITICPNPDQYVFWDSLHPTTTAHAIIGEAAFDTLSASAIPEPPATAGAILFGAFVASLTVFKRKRRLRGWEVGNRE